jgi:hypothetical protein
VSPWFGPTIMPAENATSRDGYNVGVLVAQHDYSLMISDAGIALRVAWFCGAAFLVFRRSA